MEKFSKRVCGRLFSFIPIELQDEVSFAASLGRYCFKMAIVGEGFKIINGNVPLGLQQMEYFLSEAIFSKDL